MEHRTNSEPSCVRPRIFCRLCASPLVQTADWSREDASHWKVSLWCPECGFDGTAVLDQVQAAYLSYAVEEGLACLVDALVELDALSVADDGQDLVRKAWSDGIDSTYD